MIVFKFGGASVKDPAAVKNVGAILSLYEGEKILVVVSAMGKTTNKLEEILSCLLANEHLKFHQLINDLQAYHHAILGELFREKHYQITQTIDLIFDGLRQLASQKISDKLGFEYDQIVSIGELISSHIVNEFLVELGFKSVWMDARKMIRTDDNYQEANVDWPLSKALITSSTVNPS